MGSIFKACLIDAALKTKSISAMHGFPTQMHHVSSISTVFFGCVFSLKIGSTCPFNHGHL